LQEGHFKHITGLRAYAALAVALNHSLNVLSVDGNKMLFRFLPFSMLESGNEFIVRLVMLFFANGLLAVTIFFVISGFVLGLSLDRVRQDAFLIRYLRFMLRRTFRLYPVHIAALLLITLYINFFHQPVYSNAASLWFHQFSTLDGVTWDGLRRNLFFIDSDLNSVEWILYHQMTAIFLLPVFHFISRRISLVFNIAMVFLLYYASAKVNMAVFKYLYVFYLGLILPYIKQFFHSIRADHKRMLTLLSITILILPGSTLLPSVFSKDQDIILGEAIGGLLLLGLLTYGKPIRLYNVFTWRFSQYLGKISYSFFIIHFFVLFLLSLALFNNLSDDIIQRFPLLFASTLAVCSILISIVMAGFLHKYVEAPCIRVSDRNFLTSTKWSLSRKAILLVLVSIIAVLTIGTYLASGILELKARHSFNLGQAYHQKGLTGEAIKNFQDAIELDPYFEEAYINLGVLYMTMGKHEKAIGYFEQGLELNPCISDAHHNLGYTYMLTGLTDKAVTHYLRALALKPTPDTHNNLGIIYRTLGLTEKADEQFLKAQKMIGNK
jgi:peptidoglycan/LPS O-acetylase OafA/YrhL